MWLIPADIEDVEKIYNAMVQCQILNPDPNDSLSEDGKIFINWEVTFFVHCKPDFVFESEIRVLLKTLPTSHHASAYLHVFVCYDFDANILYSTVEQISRSVN